MKRTEDSCLRLSGAGAPLDQPSVVPGSGADQVGVGGMSVAAVRLSRSSPGDLVSTGSILSPGLPVSPVLSPFPLSKDSVPFSRLVAMVLRSSWNSETQGKD